MEKLHDLFIGHSDEDIIEYLMNDNNLNEVFAKDGGATALCHAIWCKRESIAEWLIERGANFDAKVAEYNEANALQMAFTYGADDVAVRLMKAGADLAALDEDEPEKTPLHRAVDSRMPNTAEALINRGADLRAVTKDEFGVSALELAAMNGDADMEEILRAGLDRLNDQVGTGERKITDNGLSRDRGDR